MRRPFLVLCVVLLCFGSAGVAVAAPNEGACYVQGAKRAARAAHRAAVQAAKRDREARHVLAATRLYSSHDYSDFAGRHVEPVPVGRWVRLARRCGWAWGNIDHLMHIVARESSGYPGVVNNVIGCTGLLQIWPGNVTEPGRLTDPEYNLRSGLKLYREAGWTPWQL